MGDTGSELVGLLLLVFLIFGIIGVVGFKIIDRLEKNRPKPQAANNQKSSKANLPLILASLIVILGVAVVLVIILRPTPPIYDTRQPVRTGDWAIEVKSYDLPGNLLTPVEKGTAGGEEVKAAGSWLEVEVVLTNTSLTKLPLVFTNFEIHDSQNNAFLPATSGRAQAYALAKSSANAIKEGLTPGEGISLWLLYDLPPKISGLELVFKQGSNPRFRLTAGTAR